MTDPTDIVARTIPQFCRAYGVGRTRAFELIKAGKIKAVREGGRQLVIESSARAWLASLAPTAIPTDGRRIVSNGAGRRRPVRVAMFEIPKGLMDGGER